MARTPLADQLRHIASIAHEASARQVDVEQVFEERREQSASRREFLRTAGVGLAAAALAMHARPARAAEPRIVVVGAGLAGLSAAYRLKRAGYTAQVYEASDRVGGRCW